MLSSGIPYGDNVCQKALHKLQLNIFFSATVLRKNLEEENEYISFINKYRNSPFYEKPIKNNWYVLFNLQIDTQKILITKDPMDDWTAYFKDFCVEDYNLSTVQKDKQKLNDVCNWIIHSYIWALGNITNSPRISGFFVSSDRTKEECIHFILIEDWITILNHCAENAYL